MPMSARQLAQATLDYKPFLPAGARVTEVQRRHAGPYESERCDLCDSIFRWNEDTYEAEEIKLLTVSLFPGRLFKRYRMYVCRNGVTCRGRVLVPGEERRAIDVVLDDLDERQAA